MGAIFFVRRSRILSPQVIWQTIRKCTFRHCADHHEVILLPWIKWNLSDGLLRNLLDSGSVNNTVICKMVTMFQFILSNQITCSDIHDCRIVQSAICWS